MNIATTYNRFYRINPLALLKIQQRFISLPIYKVNKTQNHSFSVNRNYPGIHHSKNFVPNQNHFRFFSSNPNQLESIYESPLAKAVKVLKLISVSSVVGLTAASPFFFTIQGALPMVARIGLLATTFSLMASSLAMVTWAFKPYVTKISILNNSSTSDPNYEVSNINSDSLLFINTLDFLSRKNTTVVRANTLKKFQETPLKTWYTTSATSLSQNEHELIQNVLKNQKFSLAPENTNYYIHADMDLSPKILSLLKLSE
ncbi:hypothetical protein BB558_006894 [Smittium angustum]|uniref:Transmembrane protein 186 n=1 Tax=Smittium angustum TaxID=133377 RepID=A0A2U1IWJ7_SMIAN|nr:hypothetical protein BB558_006894 [Smittium angustum]